MDALLEINVPADRVSGLAHQLEKCGAQWIEFLPATHDDSCLEPDPGTLALWSSVKVLAQYDSEEHAAEAMTSVEGEYGLGRIRPRPIKHRDWVSVSRSGFAPRKFFERFWVVPAWCQTPESDLPIIYIEPGLAFGTGMHPSTQLCLKWLAAADVRGVQVADFGCGSGILGVVAARLGAKDVVAYDKDPQAIESAKRNADLNGVSVDVLHQAAPGDRVTDIVLANILARPLIELAPDLTMATRLGGKLILSGFTADQSDVVAAAYLPRCRVVRRIDQKEWSLLELARIPRVSHDSELH